MLDIPPSSAIASWKDMASILREPDCSASLREVGILAEGQAYTRIIEIVEVQIQPSMDTSCHRTLREHKALYDNAARCVARNLRKNRI